MTMPSSWRSCFGIAALFATLGAGGTGCGTYTPGGGDSDDSSPGPLTGASSVSATVALLSQWSDGYCAKVTVTNSGAQATSSWSVAIDVGNATPTSVWNAQPTKNGASLTLSNLGYNGIIAAHGSTEAGFCAQGKPSAATDPSTQNPSPGSQGPSPSSQGPGPGSSSSNDPVSKQSTSAGLVWPNASSSANSDPWLAQHHDEITEMHPRALVINFANTSTPAAVRARWNAMARAMGEGSRYHGYSDPNAKPFVVHELLKQVDLIDNPIPSGWQLPNSTKMPRVPDGSAMDYGQLYSKAFADLYAIPDPQNPARNLTLCELLQKGLMHELFIAIDKHESIVPEIIEYKQMYDSNDRALTGRFDPYAGNGQFDPQADLPEARACGRSLRVDFLEMDAGVDGALHVLSHNFEHLGTAVPNVKRFYSALFNNDFETRFGTFFDSWYDISLNGSTTNFLSYPTQTSVSWTCPPDTSCSGQSGTISSFSQGCGNTHYPPNARNSYDYQNTATVLTRCEHYGLHDGPDGRDKPSPYNVQTLAGLTQQFGNGINGGAWQLYLFQSIPGFGSRATTDDGAHIKNFWPYLYY